MVVPSVGAWWKWTTVDTFGLADLATWREGALPGGYGDQHHPGRGAIGTHNLVQLLLDALYRTPSNAMQWVEPGNCLAQPGKLVQFCCNVSYSLYGLP
jgi:hypothetical protein